MSRIRRPTDPPNIICLITVQNHKELHKLETKYGLLKKWFSSECLKKLTTRFINIDLVDKNIEYSVHEMIKTISGGQRIYVAYVRQKFFANQVGVYVLKITCYVIVCVKSIVVQK